MGPEAMRKLWLSSDNRQLRQGLFTTGRNRHYQLRQGGTWVVVPILQLPERLRHPKLLLRRHRRRTMLIHTRSRMLPLSIPTILLLGPRRRQLNRPAMLRRTITHRLLKRLHRRLLLLSANLPSNSSTSLQPRLPLTAAGTILREQRPLPVPISSRRPPPTMQSNTRMILINHIYTRYTLCLSRHPPAPMLIPAARTTPAVTLPLRIHTSPRHRPSLQLHTSLLRQVVESKSQDHLQMLLLCRLLI